MIDAGTTDTTSTVSNNNKNNSNSNDLYQYYDNLLVESSSCKDKNKWTELMGTDLMMKSITLNKSLASINIYPDIDIDNKSKKNIVCDNTIIDTDIDTDTSEQSNTENHNQQQEKEKQQQQEIQEICQAVQVQDAVVVDIIGRYIPLTYSTSTTFDITKIDNIQLMLDWPIFHIEQNLLVIIGDKDIIPCIEMGVRFMHKYETCLLYSHSKYAYGTGIRQSNFVTTTVNNNIDPKFIVPSNACVLYTISVKNIISSTICSTIQFKIQSCQSKKYIANDIVQNELLIGMKKMKSTNINSDNNNDNDNNSNSSILYAKGRALALYKRASDMLEYMLQQNEQQQEQQDQLHENEENKKQEQLQQYYTTIKNLYEDCLNNICVIYMICKEYKLAKESAIIVLQYNQYNIKALLIAAKASLYDPSSNYIEVQTAISAAQNVITNNTLQDNNHHTIDQQQIQLQNELIKVQLDFIRKKQQYKERNKQISTNIAKKFSSTTFTSIALSPSTTTTTRSGTVHDEDDKSIINNNNKNNTTISNKNVQQQQQHQSVQFVPNYIPTVVQWIQSNSYVSTIIRIVLICFVFQIVITVLFFIYIQFNKTLIATTATTTTHLSDDETTSILSKTNEL